MARPRIWFDFNAVGRPQVPLTLTGTLRDIKEQGIELSEGLAITLYDEDEEMDGSNKEYMLADATVFYHATERRWMAEVDWSTFRREPRSS